MENVYPISDKDAENLIPYTFTIENICSTTAAYQINLEELTTELKRLSNQYVKVSFNNSKAKLLNRYEEVTTTLNDADTSHKLTTGVLKPDETKSFDLRLWMDEDTPAINDVMNASFLSKITIITIQKEGLPEVSIVAQDNLNEITVDISTVENSNNETLTYFYQLNEEEEIESESSVHTFTNLSDGKYKARGRAETLDGIILEEKELDVTIAYEQVYISNTGNDKTGNGSIENPFASLQPAYNKVKSGGEMILLSDITATYTTNMNIENKEATLRSEGEDIYTISKGKTIIGRIIDVSNSNNITTKNVIFDGNYVQSNSLLQGANNSIINLMEGTTLKNSINVSGYGGGINVLGSTLNINGAMFQNNSSTNYYGGAIHIDSSTANIWSAKISENYADKGGGGISVWNGTLNFFDGIISMNSAKDGGGVWVSGNGKNSTMIMNNGQIINNRATNRGGGIYSSNNSSIIYIKGGIILENTAPTASNGATYNGGQIIDKR